MKLEIGQLRLFDGVLFLIVEIDEEWDSMQILLRGKTSWYPLSSLSWKRSVVISETR